MKPLKFLPEEARRSPNHKRVPTAAVCPHNWMLWPVAEDTVCYEHRTQRNHSGTGLEASALLAGPQRPRGVV